MAQEKLSYQDLKNKLDEVTALLQSEDVDVDEAIKLYEKGQQIIAELEKYLENAKHKLEKIKLGK